MAKLNCGSSNASGVLVNASKIGWYARAIKKIAIFTCCIAAALFYFSSPVVAQERKFKPFKVDYGFGYADPAAELLTKSYGACMYLEPHYRINDDWAVGCRLEVAIFKDGLNYLKNTDLILDFVNSLSPTIEYYLSRKKFRPFVGVGAGFYWETIRDMYGVFDTLSSSYKSVNKLGGFPVVGFEWQHLRFSTEYNFIGSLENNYVAIKLSRYVGGGRKK